MQQFSTDGTQVELELLSGHLLFIDPLYLQDISDNRQQIDKFDRTDKKELVKTFEKKIFPHSGGFLLGYKYVDEKIKSYAFSPAALRKWDTISQTDLSINKDITTFGVDTASFLILDLDNLNKLIDLLNYDDLIDALLSNKLDHYVETINQKLGNKGWTYIVSKGADTADDFNGDGFYIVD